MPLLVDSTAGLEYRAHGSRMIDCLPAPFSGHAVSPLLVTHPFDAVVMWRCLEAGRTGGKYAFIRSTV
jgi:hypothetical protein